MTSPKPEGVAVGGTGLRDGTGALGIFVGANGEGETSNVPVGAFVGEAMGGPAGTCDGLGDLEPAPAHARTAAAARTIHIGRDPVIGSLVAQVTLQTSSRMRV